MRLKYNFLPNKPINDIRCRCSIVPIPLSYIHNIFKKLDKTKMQKDIWKVKDLILSEGHIYEILKINYYSDATDTCWFWVSYLGDDQLYMNNKKCVKIGNTNNLY